MLNFYQSLPVTSKFRLNIDDSFFEELPKDWNVIVCDIKGSTAAVQNGKLKDVNLIGVASITTVIKALGHDDFPYVFGGDGASLCLSKEDYKKALADLQKLQRFSLSKFDIDLRVACIPASELEESKKIYIGKYELVAGKNLAIFKGGGLAYCDWLAKSQYENYNVDPTDEILEELNGLSCRWNPIQNKNGTILSLIVESKENENIAVIGEVINGIKKITKNKSINPASGIRSYKSFSSLFKQELKFHKTIFAKGFLKRIIQMFFCVLAFRFNLKDKIGLSDYEASMESHSDFQKYDDALRMIIDCSLEEKKQILDLLDSLHTQLYYGVHESDTALMTCYVESTLDGEHIHFIDGGDGGYTYAAKKLKEQKGKND